MQKIPNELDEQYIFAIQDPSDPVWETDANIAAMQQVDDPNDELDQRQPVSIRTRSGGIDFLNDLTEVVEGLVESETRREKPKTRPKLDVIPTKEMGSDKWRGGRRQVTSQMAYQLASRSPERRDLLLVNYGPGTVYLSPIAGVVAAAPNTVRLPVTASATSGVPASILVTAPAAATDWVQVVPAGESWTLLSWKGLFTTSAVVAARTINWRVEVATTFEDLVTFTAAVTQAAGLAVVYQGTSGVGELGAVRNGGLQMMFPTALQVPAGTRISSVVQNMQAGDQWSDITMEIVRSSTSSLVNAVSIPTRDDVWAVCPAGETALVEILEIFDMEA